MKKYVVTWLIMVCFFFVTSCNSSDSASIYKEGDITIYYKNDFNKSQKGFYGSKRVSQRLVDDSISGKALLTICKEKWSGPVLDTDIKGSTDLKIGFMAKGHHFKKAKINMFDKKANDNTTPYGYRFLPDDIWVPVLYHVDRFRYNSKRHGYINKETHFANIRFWGPEPKGEQVSLILDNFIVYRGVDSVPPSKVQGLKAHVQGDGVKLEWMVPHDNVFPMVYVISRASEKGNFKKIAESYYPYYVDKSVRKGVYRYRVLACDFENNIGEWSDVVEVKGNFKGLKNKVVNRLIRDRENYSKHIRKIHELGKDKVEKGRVVMYGDSLTAATVYPYFVSGALGRYKVDAFGYEGQTIEWGKKNIEKKILNRVKPEFLLIMFGTNNVRGRLRDEITYTKWVNDLIDTAKKAESNGIVVIIGTIPPRGFKDPKSFPEALFNKMLIEEARKNKIPVAYIFQEIQQSGDRHKFIWKDGIHWTEKGMEVAAKAWAKTFRQVEFVLRDRK